MALDMVSYLGYTLKKCVSSRHGHCRLWFVWQFSKSNSASVASAALEFDAFVKVAKPSWNQDQPHLINLSLDVPLICQFSNILLLCHLHDIKIMKTSIGIEANFAIYCKAWLCILQWEMSRWDVLLQCMESFSEDSDGCCLWEAFGSLWVWFFVFFFRLQSLCLCELSAYIFPDVCFEYLSMTHCSQHAPVVATWCMTPTLSRQELRLRSAKSIKLEAWLHNYGFVVMY